MGWGQEVSHAIAFAQMRRAVCQREPSFLLVEKKRLGLDLLLEVFFSPQWLNVSVLVSVLVLEYETLHLLLIVMLSMLVMMLCQLAGHG